MKILQLVVLMILTVACCVAALFLYLMYSMKAPHPVGPSSSGYTLELLAMNITILEIVLALVGFLVAIVGLFGYAGIKSAAIGAAETEARNEINAQMVKWRREQEVSALDTQSESEGDFSGEDASVVGAVPAGRGNDANLCRQNGDRSAASNRCPCSDCAYCTGHGGQCVSRPQLAERTQRQDHEVCTTRWELRVRHLCEPRAPSEPQAVHYCT